MRLIDADALMEELHHMVEGDIEVKEDYEYLGIDDCIRSQPTAYDVEKVVEQIHGYFKSVIDKSDSENVPLEVLEYNKDICDIVRGGRE